MHFLRKPNSRNTFKWLLPLYSETHKTALSLSLSLSFALAVTLWNDLFYQCLRFQPKFRFPFKKLWLCPCNRQTILLKKLRLNDIEGNNENWIKTFYETRNNTTTKISFKMWCFPRMYIRTFPVSVISKKMISKMLLNLLDLIMFSDDANLLYTNRNTHWLRVSYWLL